MTNFENSWNEYWQSGLATSCISDGKDGYPSAIEGFWKRVFRTIKSEDKIIDLCTGGGGVPQLLMNYGSNKNCDFEITLTDLAVIRNRLDAVDGTKLHYYSECNCEELPFDDSSFDHATSSFGVEYSDLNKTISEISRVVKKGGNFAAVLHTYDSEIVKNSNSQMQQAHQILYESPFFDLFKKIYQVSSKSKVFQKAAEQKLLSCLNEMKTKILHDPDLNVYVLILKAAHDIFIFGQKNKAIQCVEYINKMQKALEHNHQRMKNLSEVVLTSEGIENLIESLKDHNFSIDHDKKIISDKNKVLGLGLICKKL